MKAGAAAVKKKEAKDEDCWRGFKLGDWSRSINVRDFIVRNVTPYDGDEKFLAPASKRTKAVWEKLQPYFQAERKKGVLAVDAKNPSTLLAHKAGYIDRDNEIIVGLQTDEPFKRAIFPYGGLRMVEAGLKAASSQRIPGRGFHQIQKSHNDGVFDAYTPEIMKCRKSGIITGLPDAYGRGRIIGDYRRVALYGVDRLLEVKGEERAQMNDMWPNDEVIRVREELAEQTRALKISSRWQALQLRHRAATANDAREAFSGRIWRISARSRGQWCRHVDRAISAFDAYRARFTGRHSGRSRRTGLWDQLVQKLRMSVSPHARIRCVEQWCPYWATECVGGMDLDGRALVTKAAIACCIRFTISVLRQTEHYDPLVGAMPEPFVRFCVKSAATPPRCNTK
jgi:formate C-acetyltransferase